ncbi:DUF427 domain-containing protein [Paraburkholderia sp. CNPSo 3274]|uniref:DUF427 domain-containing protein n=1 Tax=Paraburkholderia sp. CNPSo 3274 TaxID=2940932 RepID=UPI0020B7C36B|nr:DUF427 domain-containing protein [Paraburkholderia sp. CNPSo 3274]MCP3713356.1 DUF427 domain-containing protein [Paraburkholderia sp. CNPSo 3274]
MHTTHPQGKPVKIPGPDHPITIERHPSRIVVKAGGKVIADTREALTLREARYPAVIYVPRKDVDMTLLERTDHASYCPYKGDCAYFSIPSAGERGINAVWMPRVKQDESSASIRMRVLALRQRWRA